MGELMTSLMTTFRSKERALRAAVAASSPLLSGGQSSASSFGRVLHRCIGSIPQTTRTTSSSSSSTSPGVTPPTRSCFHSYSSSPAEKKISTPSLPRRVPLNHHHHQHQQF